MKKEDFLKTLRKKLAILDTNEVEDILLEYSGYIDEKIESGCSEEEAVQSFGDIDELVQELLKAYKVNTKYQNTDMITSFSQKLMTYIEQFLCLFKGKSTLELVKIVIEVFVILFFIALCHIPVQILEQLGRSVFYILSNPLNQIFYVIWKFVLEFAYLILAIIGFAKIFRKRYFEDEELVKPIQQEKKESPKKNEQSSIKKERNSSPSVEKSFGQYIIKGIGIFFKFVAICVLFGISLYLIGLGLILGLCFYLLIKGVTYFGFYIVMIALFILGILLFRLLFNFVLDRELHAGKTLIFLIASFILLGFGCALATVEVADTTFINQAPESLTMETLTEELPYSKDLVFVGNISDYVVDNQLDHIEVLFQYYPIGTKMSTNIYKTGKQVYLGWNYNEIHITKELIYQMLNDLKEKKIYNYYLEPHIVLKANEEQLNVIKKNRQNYYHTIDKYSACEFVRTYYVENIKKTKNSEYTYLTLTTTDEADLFTVKLANDLVQNVVAGQYYEFTFKTYQSYIDTRIEEVFHDNEVLRITKTDKVGINQIQDSSCTVFY